MLTTTATTTTATAITTKTTKKAVEAKVDNPKSMASQLFDAISITKPKKLFSNDTNNAPLGKLALLRTGESGPVVGGRIPSPPLGLGVVLYLSGEVVSGVCVSGLVNSLAIDTVKKRCGSLVGMRIGLEVDKATGFYMSPVTGHPVSERVCKIQKLGLLASWVVDRLAIETPVHETAKAWDYSTRSDANLISSAFEASNITTKSGTALPLQVAYASAVYKHSPPQMSTVVLQEQKSMRKGPPIESPFFTTRS